MENELPAEDRLIAALFARHGADGDSVLTGPGDDAAVVRGPPGEDLVITTDTLNEGVHFPAGTPAHSVGYRALAVSLSDLASMGARPLWAVVTLSAPCAEEVWLEGFADGLFSLADRFGVRVVGGDFARGPLNVTVAAHGSAARGNILYRGGARAGDGIWVSGFLGDAAAGLTLLQARLKQVGFSAGASGTSPEQADFSAGASGTSIEQADFSVGASAHRLKQIAVPPAPKASAGNVPTVNTPTGNIPTVNVQAGNANSWEETLIRRFCYPRPQVELGSRLSGIASACMDLSDGLAVDLPRLLRANGLAATVRLEQLPLSKPLMTFADAAEAREIAVCGGDDYQLCFTVASSDERRLAPISAEHPLTRIGEMHEGEGLRITCGGSPWRPARKSFSHFS